MIGFLGFFTDESIPVVDVARIAEAAGVESLWFPEHTHIPVVRTSKPPIEGDIPPFYRRLFDPFVAATAAAAATTRLRLGTGVALAANHHPITLAKQIATLDHISGGRFIFGVGAGWIQEEIENHGVEHATRWKRALEHVAAMKAIWTQDEASFSGQWVNFDPIYSWPKPVQRPHPPILLGTIQPSELVVRHADGWLPLSLAHPNELAERLAVLHQRAEAAGRDPASFDITVFCLERTMPDKVAEFLEMGATRVVVRPRLDTRARFEDFLATYEPLLGQSLAAPA